MVRCCWGGEQEGGGTGWATGGRDCDARTVGSATRTLAAYIMPDMRGRPVLHLNHSLPTGTTFSLSISSTREVEPRLVQQQPHLVTIIQLPPNPQLLPPASSARNPPPETPSPPRFPTRATLFPHPTRGSRVRSSTVAADLSTPRRAVRRWGNLARLQPPELPSPTELRTLGGVACR